MPFPTPRVMRFFPTKTLISYHNVFSDKMVLILFCSQLFLFLLCLCNSTITPARLELLKQIPIINIVLFGILQLLIFYQSLLLPLCLSLAL
jgi:hypothetical protein